MNITDSLSAHAYFGRRGTRIFLEMYTSLGIFEWRRLLLSYNEFSNFIVRDFVSLRRLHLREFIQMVYLDLVCIYLDVFSLIGWEIRSYFNRRSVVYGFLFRWNILRLFIASFCLLTRRNLFHIIWINSINRCNCCRLVIAWRRILNIWKCCGLFILITIHGLSSKFIHRIS